MLSIQLQTAIAPQPVDELTRASTELATHLESIANSIASHALPPSFENIRPGLRNVALDVVESFKQSAFKALEQITEMDVYSSLFEILAHGLSGGYLRHQMEENCQFLVETNSV